MKISDNYQSISRDARNLSFCKRHYLLWSMFKEIEPTVNDRINFYTDGEYKNYINIFNTSDEMNEMDDICQLFCDQTMDAIYFPSFSFKPSTITDELHLT